MRNKTTAAVALVAAVAFTGCHTVTKVDRINGNQFIVCDDGGSHCNGANPEKGLDKTCPSIGRYIANYRKLKTNGNKLIVSCGPVTPEVRAKQIANSRP